MAKRKTDPHVDDAVFESLNTAMDRLCASRDADAPLHLAVAVSGGADSMALLHLLLRWGRNRSVTLVALTVDHGLREASAAEAQGVAAWCRQQGIEHHILPWTGEKPASAIQEKARSARRRLLCDFCASRAITHLALGHQADDQAETFLMRLLRGSGLKGLGVMRPETLDRRSNVTLWRPVLEMCRAALREYCLRHDVAFVDDPSNDDPFYERVRLRAYLEKMPALADGIARTVPRLVQAEQALQELADTWLQNHGKQIPDKEDNAPVWLPLAPFHDLHEAVRLRVLEHLAARYGDGTRPRLQRLEEWERKMRQDGFAGANFGGCHARPRKQDGQRGLVFSAAPPRRAVTGKTAGKMHGRSGFSV